MEVKTGEIDNALENVYEGTISQDEVASLLGEIKDEQAMGAAAIGGSVGVGAVANANPASAAQKNEVDDMQAKLDQLKNMWRSGKEIRRKNEQNLIIN